MIDKAINFLRETLNTALASERLTIIDETTAEQDLVVFLDGDKVDPLVFPLNAISVLLMNVQQETTLRRADQYRSATEDGKPLRVSPDLHLELSVLFVARFKQYDAGLKVLSGIIQFFQEHPYFDRQGYPGLPSEIDRLKVEFNSMPMSEQNEIWNALRVTYMPSILYRVRLVIVSDRSPVAPPIVSDTETKVEQRN